MKDERPTHLDLFSGIGGFALAAQWAGFRTVAFVEREPFCQKILAQHWSHVPIYSDICQFGGRPFAGVDLLTGGFPCQPFSVAGEQRGKEDDRYLWPEMFRVIREANPAWIIGENVAGLDGLGLDDCISDLESIGYEVAPPLEIPACAVDAKHVRNRVWIVANSKGFNQGGLPERAAPEHTGPELRCKAMADTVREQADGDNAGGFLNEPSGGRETMADTTSQRQQRSGQPIQRCRQEANREGQTDNAISMREHGIWPTEPQLGRVANGVPDRTHRLKGLGNAIVPQVAFQIIKEIRKLI